MASKIQNQEFLIEFFYRKSLFYSLFQWDQKNYFHFCNQEIQAICSRICGSVVYQPLPDLSLLGRMVSNPCLSEKGHSCWGNERWSPNLAWGEKLVLTPILEATVCHRVSLGDSIEWPYLISVAGLLKFIEKKVNKNTVTDSGQCLTSLCWHYILDLYWSAV